MHGEPQGSVKVSFGYRQHESCWTIPPSIAKFHLLDKSLFSASHRPVRSHLHTLMGELLCTWPNPLEALRRVQCSRTLQQVTMDAGNQTSNPINGRWLLYPWATVTDRPGAQRSRGDDIGLQERPSPPSSSVTLGDQSSSRTKIIH